MNIKIQIDEEEIWPFSVKTHILLFIGKQQNFTRAKNVLEQTMKENWVCLITARFCRSRRRLEA